MKTLVLIDSNAIIHRAYHALPKNMKTSRGELTNVVYGYATTLVKVLEDLKPDYIAASFDLAAKTFRHEEYKEYKATRVKADQELYDQIPRVRELLEVLNIPVYEMEGFEADDCIGTMVDKIQNESEDVANYIVTGDKDAFQLIDGNIFVYNLKHGLASAQIVDRKVIEEEWGLQPEDFIDLKALAGDPSDNIPGVPNIGVKTATSLLIAHDSLANLYLKIQDLLDSEGIISKSEFLISNENSNSKIENLKNEQLIGRRLWPDPVKMRENWKLKIENSKPAFENIAKILGIKPRILGLLVLYKDQAFLSQRLATIRRDVPLDFDLEKCKWGDYDREKLKNFFQEMQFHSLLKRFGAERGEEPKTKEAIEQKEKDEQLKLL